MDRKHGARSRQGRCGRGGVAKLSAFGGNFNGHLYVGDLAGVHSMEFRGVLFSEVSNVLV